MLLLICATGRATPRHDGLRWGVVIDRPQELVVDHINPRNSAAFSWSRSYFTPPDGMRVRFLDETNDYQEAERITGSPFMPSSPVLRWWIDPVVPVKV